MGRLLLAASSPPELHLLACLARHAPQVDAANMRPADWDRLRAGIALKTFTALIKQYQARGRRA